MSKCNECGVEVNFPFNCNYCNKLFCDKHRLPESHNCLGLPKERTWENRKIIRKKKEYSRNDYGRKKRTYSNKQKSPSRRKSSKKKIAFVLVAVFIISIILVLFWNNSLFDLFFLNDSQSQTNDASYTELTLRSGDSKIIEFGDTEYSLYYGTMFLEIHAPFKNDLFRPSEVKTFRNLGLEIKVSKIDEDYLSKYVVILVKPTIQNYMSSLFYTKVIVPLYQTKTVNISSGLIDKTNEYWFSYSQEVYSLVTEHKLTIGSGSQSETKGIAEGLTYKLFEIETKIYKINSDNIVIYVKPLY